MQAPASPQYMVLAPGFFRGMEKLVQSHSDRTMAGLSALVDSDTHWRLR